MEINIFILCFNESHLLPHTINHYKKYLPSCKITIYDNQSTDNSVKLALSLGCNVISWSSNNQINDHLYLKIKNNCWKNIKNGWIIMIDMDEFLCVTEDELLDEIKNETSILEIKGLEMIGESNKIDLTDIDLQKINKYVDKDEESKKLCFLREKITEMNYEMGAHHCNHACVCPSTGGIHFVFQFMLIGLLHCRAFALSGLVKTLSPRAAVYRT